VRNNNDTDRKKESMRYDGFHPAGNYFVVA
jgi:hypothetical protein